MRCELTKRLNDITRRSHFGICFSPVSRQTHTQHHFVFSFYVDLQNKSTRENERARYRRVVHFYEMRNKRKMSYFFARAPVLNVSNEVAVTVANEWCHRRKANTSLVRYYKSIGSIWWATALLHLHPLNPPRTDAQFFSSLRRAIFTLHWRMHTAPNIFYFFCYFSVKTTIF